MLTAALVAMAALALGAALGLTRQRWALPGVRTFAIVSSLAVVLAQLLPDAVAAVGAAALAVFAGALVLPAVVERLTVARADQHALGLELSYAALLLHKLGDGLGLGAFGHASHAGHQHVDLFLALAAHTVPVTALVVLTFAKHRGVRAALLRALGLAAATLAGMLVAGAVPHAVVDVFEPWIAAAVGGLLLHIVIFDWREESDAPRTDRDRVLDVVAVAAGLLLVAVGGDLHHPVAGELRESLSASLWRLALLSAWPLAVGLLAAAIVATLLRGRRLGAAAAAAATTTVVVASLLGVYPAVLAWLVGMGFVAERAVATDELLDGRPPTVADLVPGLDAEVLATVPWAVAYLLLAAAADTLLPTALAPFPFGTGALLVGLVAVPAGRRGAVVVPLVLVLAERGFGLGAAVGGLVFAATAAEALRGQRSLPRAAVTLAVVALWSSGLAFMVDVGLGVTAPSTGFGSLPALRIAGLAVLGLLAARSVWQAGFLRWLGAITDGRTAIGR